MIHSTRIGSHVLMLRPPSNRRKIRCTGIQPCELCVRTGSQCSYNASYARGRRPPVAHQPSAASLPMDVEPLDAVADDSLMSSLAVPEATEAAGQPPDSSATLMDSSGLAVTVGTVAAEPPSRASPEPTQTDLQGHYVGPASGVSFLLRVQKRLHQAVSFSQTSSIFTFGDAPLPDFDPTFCILLSKDEATHLMQRYFDFAVPTHRFLHRPTVESWLEEFYDTMGVMRNKEDAPARIALLFMIFAQAQAYMTPGLTAPNGDMRFACSPA